MHATDEGAETAAPTNAEPTTEESPVLRADGIDAGYGEVQVLRDVSFELADEEILSIIGPNGAGKTTLMGVLAGLIDPSAGTVSLRGTDVTDAPAHERASLGVSLVSEDRNLFRSMTVRENLVLGFYGRSGDRAERLRTVFDLFPRLEDRQGQRAATLSGGEAQMLALGRSLMADPDVLLLDEPSLGLAPKLIPDLFETVRDVNETGVPIVLVEQRARKALEVADDGCLLENGQITHRASGDEMLADDRVVEKYLGGNRCR